MSLLLIATTTPISGQTKEKIELMYDNVWGSLYNPVREQCDKTPTITADGSVIDTLRASQQRWIAISQDLLWSPRRHRLFVNDPVNDHRYKGRIKFGDTIWIESPNPNINGKWVVHDLMNKKHKNAVDFLQTAGDGRLYNNDKLWDGKFKIISVYKINKNVDNYKPKVVKPNLWMFRPSISISAMTVSYDVTTGNFVERPKLPQMIQCDSVKYFNIINRIFSPDWNLHYKIEEKKKELKKIQHQIDSLQIEMHKYEMIREWKRI
jgi:hypothetical protein